MAEEMTATASGVIAAKPAAVWAVVNDPELRRRVFVGTSVQADLRAGGGISVSGRWEGDSHGRVRVGRHERLDHIRYRTVQPDQTQNRGSLTFHLKAREDGTELTVTQGELGSAEELRQAEADCAQVLEAVRQLAEGRQR